MKLKDSQFDGYVRGVLSSANYLVVLRDLPTFALELVQSLGAVSDYKLLAFCEEENYDKLARLIRNQKKGLSKD